MSNIIYLQYGPKTLPCQVFGCALPATHLSGEPIRVAGTQAEGAISSLQYPCPECGTVAVLRAEVKEFKIINGLLSVAGTCTCPYCEVQYVIDRGQILPPGGPPRYMRRR